MGKKLSTQSPLMKWALLVAASLIGIFAVFGLLHQPSAEIVPLSQTINNIDAGGVRKIAISGEVASVELNNGAKQQTRLGDKSESLEKSVLTYNQAHTSQQIELSYKPESQTGSVAASLIFSLLPVLLIGGFLYYMMRQAQGTNNQALSFGKSRARLNIAIKSNTKFEDVAGVDEAKLELSEIVEFLKFPDKFVKLGAKIPKGVLLIGPPGTGKTMLARAIAGEAEVPFFSISGSEFVEMFVGVGASRVRDLFDQAKRNSPAIIFIDEVDAVGRHRGSGVGGSHDEREQTLNQILVEMDGFEQETHVIIVAATNRPDVLDQALLRPGRFDRQVVLDRPDIKGREGILRVHAKGKPLAPDVDLLRIAKVSPGFSGADLANVVNEGAILAARAGRSEILMADVQSALEKVSLGPERRSRVISDKEKRIVAYHEAGHALCFKLLKHTNPVHKISIVSRGMAMGVTWSLPEEDRYFRTRAEFKDDIAAALGGWTAEQLLLEGDVTTGAASDIDKATEMARAMVTRYGMSTQLGPVSYARKDEAVFMGRQMQEDRNYSEESARVIDKEVHLIVEEATEKAHSLLVAHRAALEAVVEKLLQQETLDAQEFDEIVEKLGVS